MLVPKLRFKREDGTDYPEWEEKKLGSVCDSIGDGLHKAPSYDESGDYYFINGNNLKNGKIVIEKQTPKVSVGTLQKSDKSLDTATILMSINGTIGNLAFYQDEKIMLGKSVAYLKVSKNVCKKYIYSVLQTRKVTDNFKLSVTGTTIKNLGLTAIRDTPIFIPCLEEQQKIADFLSNVDEVIAQSEAEVANLQQQKKAAMQKIFSQEVRFKREDGISYPEWEDWVLDSIGSFYGGLSGKTKEDFGKGNSKFVTYMNVYKNIFAMQEMLESVDISDNEKQNKVKYGDLLMTQSSETVEELGMSSVYLFYDEPYLNSFCFGLHLYNHALTYPMYIGYLMRSEAIRKQIMREGQGISRINLSPNRMKGMILSLPCLEEQQKIADFLATYDEAISCAKQELDKWKELKKGLLQQMFA